jgi:hypothetical protein
MFWQTTRYSIDLTRPRVMGIVNVTPDSFSDGGRLADLSAALNHCERLLRDGAHILDIGGESTRPGAPPVPLEEELARVVPLVREAVRFGVPISVDTFKPAVMQAVLDLGADIINDIRALGQPGAVEVVSRHPSCGICLMHMHRDPLTMQVLPMQGDVVPPVRAFLSQAAVRATVGRGGARAHRAGSGDRFWQDRGTELQPAGSASRVAGRGVSVAGGLVAQVIVGRGDRHAGRCTRGSLAAGRECGRGRSGGGPGCHHRTGA